MSSSSFYRWGPLLSLRMNTYARQRFLSCTNRYTRLGAMISPGLHLLVEQFDKSLGTISTYLVGLFIFWTDFFTFFSSAAASVWGKRVVFVLSTGALGVLNIWGFFATVRTELARASPS